MFTLSIPSQETPVNIVTVGRTAPFPIYFMHRNGRPVFHWVPLPKVKGQPREFVKTAEWSG